MNLKSPLPNYEHLVMWRGRIENISQTCNNPLQVLQRLSKTLKDLPASLWWNNTYIYVELGKWLTSVAIV